MPQSQHPPIATSIAPWQSVKGSAKAVAFYEQAFGAVETFHLEDPDGNVVAKLSVDGAEFWVGDESPEHGNLSPRWLRWWHGADGIDHSRPRCNVCEGHGGWSGVGLSGRGALRLALRQAG